MPGLETLSPPSQASGNAPDRKTGGLDTQRPGVDDEPLRLVLAGLDKSADAMARQAAHEDLSQRPEGSLWKRLGKSVWNNLSHEYQVVSRTKERREEILESGNLLHHQGLSDQSWRDTTIDRMSSDLADDMLREGETLHRLRDAEHQGDPNAQLIIDGSTKLLRDYARGDILDEEDLAAAIKDQMDEWREGGVSQELLGEGRITAHNFAALGEQIRAMMLAKQGLDALQFDSELDDILSKVEIITGEAKVGNTTEIGETVSERLAAKLSKVPYINEGRLSKVTSFLTNETTVAAMTSFAVAAGQKGISLATVAVPGIAGGIVAGVRERNNLKRERALLAIRLDRGEKVDLNDRRQSELAETLYEARPIEDLLSPLKGAYDDEGKLNVNSHDDLAKIMQAFSEASARQQRTAEGKRLISFENIQPENMEEQRFDLELTLAKLETDLKKLFGNPVARGALDILDNETFEQWNGLNEAIMTGQLEGHMDDKDRLFHKLTVKRGLKRAFVGTLIGAGIGLGEHEIAALAGHAAETLLAGDHTNAADLHMQTTAFETSNPGPHAPVTIGHPVAPDTIGHVATPANIGHPVAPDTIGHPSAPSQIGHPSAPADIGHGPSAPTEIGHGTAPNTIGHTEVPDTIGHAESPSDIGQPVAPEVIGSPNGTETHVISDLAKINLPKGYEVTNQGGLVTIKGPDGLLIRDLVVNKDGSFSGDSLKQLQGAGFKVGSSTDIIKGPDHIQHETLNASGFVNNHKGDMARSRVVGSMDNNTGRSDLNELGVQHRVDAHGNIIIDISGMSHNGSFHGNSGIDWAPASRDGHMVASVSASRGTQTHTFMIKFNADGIAVVDRNSAAGALYSADGKLQGGFETIALDGGKDAKGFHQLVSLATVVGSNKNSFTDTIATPTMASSHTYTLTPPAPATAPVFQPTAAGSSAFAPIIPLMGRTRLGRAPGQPGPTATATAASAGPIPRQRQASSAGGLPGAQTGSSTSSNTGTNPGPAPSSPNIAGASQPNQAPNNGNNIPGVGQGPNSASASQPNQAPDNGNKSPDTAGSTPNATGPDNPNVGQTPPSPDQAAAEEEARRREAEQAQREQEQAQRAERLFAAMLDAETLQTPAGYDFQGYATFGSRERKLAMRFVAQAQREVSNDDDKAAIAARAQELAANAAKDTTGKIADMYREALTILQKSAERIAAQTADTSDNQDRLSTMLRDLDAEDRPYPFAGAVSLNVKSGMDAFGKQAAALATRAVLSAQDSLAKKSGESDDAYRKRVIRRAMSRITSLQTDNPELFEQASRVLTASLPPNKQEFRASNPWEKPSS